MRDVLDQIDSASRMGLYYLALMGALAIPDMCGKLETPNVCVKERWSRWYEENIDSFYLSNSPSGAVWLSGADAYQFRCSFLHEGSAQSRPETAHGRIIFVEPGNLAGPVHLNGIEFGGVRALTLDVSTFVSDVTSAARHWLDRVEGTEPFETNFSSRFVRRYPEGFPGFIGGVPVIA